MAKDKWIRKVIVKEIRKTRIGIWYNKIALHFDTLFDLKVFSLKDVFWQYVNDSVFLHNEPLKCLIESDHQ